MTDPDSTTPDSTESTSTDTVAVVATNGASPKGKRWQRVVSVVLLVLGFILVPLSAVAIWSHNQLMNTDRYVETVSPLAGNKDIQQAVAARVVTALFDQVDPAKRIEDALPSRPGSSANPSRTPCAAMPPTSPRSCSPPSNSRRCGTRSIGAPTTSSSRCSPTIPVVPVVRSRSTRVR